MKKFIYSAMAVAMLATTSCKDDLAESFVGEEATVEFSISTPEIATRAYSDGTTATHLQYAVYDAAGNILNDLTKTDATINGSTTVNLKLTTGNTYSVIFWAAAPNAPYTVDFTNKTMTVDYSAALSNDENRDAFYKYHTFTVNGAQTETIELKRPFAQLNIGTADYAASTSAGYTPTQSAVKVSNVYSTLNLETGAVDGGSEVTFATADIKKDETFPVAGYEYLAMNYLLVNGKETVEVEFTYTDGTDAKTRTVGSVPVQRNYRTNIYGQLLTSDVDINVTINPIYNEPDYTVFEAFANGGTVTLTEDVVIDRTLVVKEGVKAVLNLNGHKIINTSKSTDLEKGDGIIVYGDLTINGEGTVQGNTRAVWARSNTGAKVRINGGNYVGAVGGACEVIYASGNGVIDIYGGTFEAKTQDTNSFAAPQYAVLNLHGNGKDGCDIKVYGGAFKNFNPADNISENPKHNFCAEGYTAVEKDGWYVVGKAVSNIDELKNALNNASLINVEQAINNGIESLFITGNDVVINMENKNIQTGGTASSKNYGFRITDSNVTFNDANLSGGGIAVHEGSKVTFNSGVFKVNYSGSSRYAFYIAAGSEVVVNDGNFIMERTSCPYFYIPTGAKVTINGGRFVEKPVANNADKDRLFIVDGGELIIKGGEFQKDPTEWVAAGYKAVNNGSTWTVVAE